MKLARFLGWKDETGEPTGELSPLKEGDLIKVFPRFKGYTGDYPWADKPNNTSGWDSPGLLCFRENELEMLEDVEVNLDDYL